MPPVASASAGVQGQMPSRTGPPPVPPGQSPPSASSSPPNAAGADAQQQQMMAGIGRIRDLADQAKQLAADFPAAADAMQQIQQLLKQAVVQMSAPAPVQTGSSMMVPTAGR